MPEGDTILRTARALKVALAGQTVTGLTAAARQVAQRRPERLIGQSVADVESRGKHLLCWFAPDDLALHTHLGMNGSWHLYAHDQRWRRPARAARLTITTSAAIAVCFSPSLCRLLSRAEVERDAVLARLGPDALGEVFDLAAARGRLDRRGGQAIAEALLDQRVLAGVGNIFKSEVLFSHRVDPWACVADLPGETRDALLAAAARMLAASAAPGGRRPAGVYGRAGRPCPRCGARIRSARQGDHGRATYWCAACQGPGPDGC